MHRGYIKLWRKTFNSSVWKNQILWRFWTWCLLKASHKKHVVLVGFKEVELNPGQFVFGRRMCAEETGLSEQNIRTCIRTLTTTNLTIKPTNKFSVITIINWESYQSQENNINQQITSKQPASNQQVTTNKNDKNVKKEKLPAKDRFNSNGMPFELSMLLLTQILSGNPKFKKPNIQKWCEHIDKAIRLDKRTPEELRRVIIWCQKDDFWQANILSTDKLRKQFDKLWAKMNKPKGPNEF